MAYLKMGIFGDTGSGKTWTASEVAMGLHKYIKSEKPVAFFDTETGSDFMIPKFKSAGIELLVCKGTSLKELSEVMIEAEQGCSVLIIDSITNVWDEFTDAYMRKRKQNYIELWDWKPIKKEWRNSFRNPFINTKLHIIMCGREGAVYEAQEENKNGKVKKTQVKSGTKMRAEGDTGYEPSLLCEMEKIYSDGNSQYVRRCNIVKERYGVIDSLSFDNPVFDNFLPHVSLLNIGGDHVGILNQESSEEMFDDEGNGKLAQILKKKEIVIEELSNELFLMYPGTSGDMKKNRIILCRDIFGTDSWEGIKRKSLSDLEKGLMEIRDIHTKIISEEDGPSLELEE